MARTPRPFAPADFAPGASIEWTQEHAQGARVTRRGQVWADAPICHGGTTVWAIDEDNGEAVVVCRVRKGTRGVQTFAGKSFGPGELFSETHASTPTGSLTNAAMRHAYAERQAKRAA